MKIEELGNFGLDGFPVMLFAIGLLGPFFFPLLFTQIYFGTQHLLEMAELEGQNLQQIQKFVVLPSFISLEPNRHSLYRYIEATEP